MKLRIFNHGLSNLNDVDGAMLIINDFVQDKKIINQQVIQSNNFAYVYIWYED